jgi:hypothetical protein
LGDDGALDDARAGGFASRSGDAVMGLVVAWTVGVGGAEGGTSGASTAERVASSSGAAATIEAGGGD